MSDPMQIPCEQVMERLWEFLDGELPDDAHEERIRQHLERCQRCFPQYDFERAYLRFVRRTAQPGVPPELRARVFRSMLQQRPEEADGMEDADGGERG